MSKILNAMDAIERVNNLFGPLREAAEQLQQLGGVESAAAELQGRINTLTDKRAAMEADLQEAEARIASAPGIVTAAQSEANDVLRSAHEESIKLVNMAKANAESIVAEQTKQVDKLREELGVIRSQRAEAENQLLDMREQVLAEQRKLDEVRAQVAKVKAEAIAALG